MLDFLANVTYEPASYSGVYKVLNSTPILDELADNIAGVYKSCIYKNEAYNGLFIARSVMDAGKYPGSLEDYPLENSDRTPSGMKLRSYQRRSITFLRLVDREREGALLVASPGLGKTISAIHALWLDGFLEKPGLIMAPNLAKPVWCDGLSDLRVHYGIVPTQLAGVKDIDVNIVKAANILFCHYEILHAWLPAILVYFDPAWIICDEIHYLVNQKNARTHAARQIALKGCIERRYGLTGTAIPNSRLDLWSELAIVQPRQWGNSKHQFGVRYCGGHIKTEEEGGYWDYTGETYCTELRARLAGTYLRYTSEVADKEGLPPMKLHRLEVETDDQELLAEYSKAQLDIKRYVKDAGGDSITTSGAARLVCISTLINILSRIKTANMYELMNSVQLFERHKKIVVFSWLKETAKAISEKLTEQRKNLLIVGPVDGNLTLKRRNDLAAKFAKAESAVFVATMGAAGTAINSLSSASAVWMAELYWNDVRLQQAEKRVHRDGCKAAVVDVYYPVYKDSVDDMFLEKLTRKANTAKNVSSADTSGVNLVADLTPEYNSDEKTLNEFYSLMQDYANDEYSDLD